MTKACHGRFPSRNPDLDACPRPVLPYRFNRRTDIIIGTITIAFTFAIGAGDVDDVFFAAVELVTLGVIIWVAWTWRD